MLKLEAEIDRSKKKEMKECTYLEPVGIHVTDVELPIHDGVESGAGLVVIPDGEDCHGLAELSGHSVH